MSKRPRLRELRVGRRFDHKSGRLVIDNLDGGASFVVPPGCTLEVIAEGTYLVTSDGSAFKCLLYTQPMEGWFTEPVFEGGEWLLPQGSPTFSGGVECLRFASPSQVAYRFRILGAFDGEGGRLHGMAYGSVTEEPSIMALLDAFLPGVHFVFTGFRLSEERLGSVLTNYLNLHPYPQDTGADAIVYVDRNRGLLHTQVIEAMERLAAVAAADRHPSAGLMEDRLRLLKNAAASVQSGSWDTTVRFVDWRNRSGETNRQPT